jgi:hypothetical protein
MITLRRIYELGCDGESESDGADLNVGSEKVDEIFVNLDS